VEMLVSFNHVLLFIYYPFARAFWDLGHVG
jgi:hypothetical protein